MRSAYADYAGGLLAVHRDVFGALEWFRKTADDLHPLDAQKMGLLESVFSDTLPERRAGFVRLSRAAADNARAVERGEIEYLTPGNPYFYTTLVSPLQEVALDSTQALRLAAVVRAIGEQTNTLDMARQELREFDPFAQVSRALDSPAARAQARLLQGDQQQSPDLADAVASSKPPDIKQLLRPEPTAQAAPAQSIFAPPPQPDREQQARTGYMPRAPIAANEGLSRFTVDNTDGAGDAVARLYLNGAKPAVRSFFIKQGESFTANKLSPGSYVMRYRYMGSDDTYEADRTFAVRQQEVDGGIRSSEVKVTLFTVADGNMKTKKVAPESF